MNDTPLIAIIDDDPPLRSALGNLIRSAGYEAKLFADAASALDCPDGARVALVLSDFRMPGASGVDLIAALRTKGRTMPVIIMTAQPVEDVIGPAIAAGAFACLQKPFNDHDLLDSIESALLEPGGRPRGDGPTA